MSEDKQKTEEEIRAAKETELAAVSQEIPQNIDPKIDETIDSTGLEIADEIAPDTEAPIDKDALLQTMEAQGADPVVVRELERTLTGEETPQQVLNKARGNSYLQAAIVFIAFMLALVAAPGAGRAESPTYGDEGSETASLEKESPLSVEQALANCEEAYENKEDYDLVAVEGPLTYELKIRHKKEKGISATLVIKTIGGEVKRKIRNEATAYRGWIPNFEKWGMKIYEGGTYNI